MKIEYDLKLVEPKYHEFLIDTFTCMEEVLADERFLKNLEAEVAKTGLNGELSEWKHKTAKEIYDQLLPISLELKTYYTSNNVIGYGYPSTKIIYLNRKYLDRYRFDAESMMKCGSNLVHEHGHDCGFKHDYYARPRRKNSICYTLNRVFEKTFKEHYEITEESASKIRYTPWYRRALMKVVSWF